MWSAHIMTYNACCISWNSNYVFFAPNVGFLGVGIIEAWNSTLGGKEHNFLLEYGCCKGCPNSTWPGLQFSSADCIWINFWVKVQLNYIQLFDPTDDDRLTQTVINFGLCQIQHLPREKHFVVITPPVQVCCWYSFQHWMICPSCRSAKNSK